MSAAAGASAAPALRGVAAGCLNRVQSAAFLLFLAFLSSGLRIRPAARAAGMALLLASAAAAFVRLRQEVHIERVVVERVEEHGQQVDAFACAFVLELLGSQFSGHGHIAFGSGPLEAGEAPEAAFELRLQAVGDDGCHFLVRGILHLHHVDAVVPGYALKLHALHDVHERNDRAGSAGAARAACAVDVAFVIFRRLVEENVGQGRNVYASRGDVRGHEEADLPFADSGHDGFPVALAEVGRELVGVVAEALEHAADVMHVGLRVAEDDGRGRVFHLDDSDEGAVLVHGGNGAEIMLHLGHVHFLLGEGKHGRIRHEFLGEIEDVRRIGG